MTGCGHKIYIASNTKEVRVRESRNTGSCLLWRVGRGNEMFDRYSGSPFRAIVLLILITWCLLVDNSWNFFKTSSVNFEFTSLARPNVSRFRSFRYEYIYNHTVRVFPTGCPPPRHSGAEAQSWAVGGPPQHDARRQESRETESTNRQKLVHTWTGPVIHILQAAVVPPSLRGFRYFVATSIYEGGPTHKKIIQRVKCVRTSTKPNTHSGIIDHETLQQQHQRQSKRQSLVAGRSRLLVLLWL